MVAIRSSDTSVLTTGPWRYIPDKAFFTNNKVWQMGLFPSSRSGLQLYLGTHPRRFIVYYLNLKRGTPFQKFTPLVLNILDYEQRPH
jgi:hypothetical protein